LISHWNAFRRPSARRVDSIVPTAPLSNSTAASIASSTLHEAGDGAELADEVARQVDHMGAEVSERAGSGLVRIEAPGVERRVVAPVL
jgi:predicted transcriptional regulator